MTIPIAIAEMAIFIIGAEILLLRPLAVMSLLAMKYSGFKIRFVVDYYVKLRQFADARMWFQKYSFRTSFADLESLIYQDI